MKKLLSIVCILIVASCASNSGVVPIGKEQFFISKQAATGFTGLGTLKAEAIKEGTQFCSATSLCFYSAAVQSDESPPMSIIYDPRAPVSR